VKPKDIVLIQKTKEVIYLNVNRYKKKESSLKDICIMR
jgi:hypothetical protein